MVVNKLHVRQKLKYPKSVFFIISNEFCERFCYYGMRTILSLYLFHMLEYSEDTSTIIYHVFTCFVYFFPLFGAIISDSWLGKFNTILYLSIFYAIGEVILSLSAAPAIGLPMKEFSMFGLVLIALGSGGIKPCVSAFGGDQFVLPEQEKQLAMFFSLFYFSVNTGSLISTIITPILREQECFGTDCYFAAFLVPGILMIISIVIFVSGKGLYKMVKPTGNLIVTVSKCIGHAIHNKIKSKGQKRDHWLDYADDIYDNKLIEDVKIALRVLKLFIPLPLFWTLFDQQGSQWTFQAARMDGQIGTFVLLPDQLQAVNPLLIIIFIPIFETCIYPAFAKIHFIDTPLKKLVAGGILASLSFVVSGIVELEIEKTNPVLPTNGFAQIRIFNTMNCQVALDMGDVGKFDIHPLNTIETLEVKANGSVTISYTANFGKCNDYSIRVPTQGKITAKEAVSTSFAITPEEFYSYEDNVKRQNGGKPLVRSLFYLEDGLSNVTLKVQDKDKKEIMSISMNSSQFLQSELKTIDHPWEYDVYLDETLLEENVPFKSGGVFTIVGSSVTKNQRKISGKTVTVTTPNSLHMAWMIPQYIVMTMGEVMFSVTGLQFAFTQAPLSMKSLLTAGWLMSMAVGNLIVVIIKGAKPFDRQVYEIFLYAGLMAVVMVIFCIMTLFYKYVEISEEDDNEGAIPLEGKNGFVNSSYKEDEK